MHIGVTPLSKVALSMSSSKTLQTIQFSSFVFWNSLGFHGWLMMLIGCNGSNSLFIKPSILDPFFFTPSTKMRIWFLKWKHSLVLRCSFNFPDLWGNLDQEDNLPWNFEFSLEGLLSLLLSVCCALIIVAAMKTEIVHANIILYWVNEESREGNLDES